MGRIIFVAPLLVPGLFRKNQGKVDVLRPEKTLVLKGVNYSEKITIKSYPLEPFAGNTDVYVGSHSLPQFSISGFLHNVYSLDLENDGWEEVAIEVETGHSINSLIYKQRNDRLVRIPISTEILINFEGIVSRNTPEFKDIDRDGRLEMLAYYRFFPPEKRRKVEVYKFTGLLFQKVKEYEEKMTEIYL